MKKFLSLVAIFAVPVTAHAGSCHGEAKPTETRVEVVDRIEVDIVEAPKADAPTSIIAPPQSLGLAFRNANREARATKRAAIQARRASKFAAKAGDAAGQEARQEEVMKAYQQ
jgi:hypothetical protein